MTASMTFSLGDSLEDSLERPPEGPEVTALRRENDQLREALGSRAVIDKAVGALMLRYGVTDDAAFDLLRRWSQTSNIKVRTIANTLIHAVCQGDDAVRTDPALAEWLDQEVRRPIWDTSGRIVRA